MIPTGKNKQSLDITSCNFVSFVFFKMYAQEGEGRTILNIMNS